MQDFSHDGLSAPEIDNVDLSINMEVRWATAFIDRAGAGVPDALQAVDHDRGAAEAQYQVPAHFPVFVWVAGCPVE